MNTRTNGDGFPKKTNRHQIRFQVSKDHNDLESAVLEVQVLIRARNGWSTRAIAEATGLSEGQVNYRIKKGEGVGTRKEFRDGTSWVSQAAMNATARGIVTEIAKNITPKYQ